jgi:hypothetical protein
MQIPTSSATCIAPVTGTIDHNDWDLVEPVRCGLTSIGTVKAAVPGGTLSGKTCARHYEIVRYLINEAAAKQNGTAGRLMGALPPPRPRNSHVAMATTRH